MSEITNKSLKKIGKGTIVLLVGTVAGMFFAFITRILIARYGMASQYGLFSLALVVLNISVVIATLGLQDGAARYIAYFRGKNETSNIPGAISTSIQFATLASIFLCLVLFCASDIIATKIFHNSELIFPLKVFAFCIPFITLINIFVSIFRGFDSMKEKAYFKDILSNVLFLLLLLPIVFLRLSFVYVFYAYLISLALCGMALVLYAVKKLPLKLVSKVSINPVGKDLLFFSLPLLGVAMIGMIITWTDTLMLGYFKTLDVVGLYSVAYPLASFIGMLEVAVLLAYGPITAGLYAKNLVPEIRRTYTILTKWIFSATLPLALIFLLFPEIVLCFLFGANYSVASQALQILSLGFIIGTLLGPNGATLTAIGETRFLMWASMAAAGTNIFLNITLIPPFGIVGASIATAVSINLHYLIKHLKLHSIMKANPFSKNLLKPAIIFVGLISLFYFMIIDFLNVVFWMLPLLFIIFYGLYFSLILFSKSLDQEDIMMLLELERKFGINATWIKKVISKFL